MTSTALKSAGKSDLGAAAAATQWSRAASSEQTQYLTFMLEKETFALGILAVKEIIEYHELTAVPMMPRAVRGVINLRGSVVPVIDLAVRFGRKPTNITKRTCIVIVEVESGTERQDIGVIVDAVNQVLEIPAGEIAPPPPFGARIRSDFIQGMGKVDGKFVILLDVSHVLSIDEMSVLAEAKSSEAASIEDSSS
ncbi:MAG TPA: chemotaxis protein CheW [Polyangiales bacterium]|nr:chemotaxis protein CheW [Polyangiales bacterium]